MHAKFHLENLK